MAEPQVTITLGRSGQVVKKSEASRASSQLLSGGKRPMSERFENDVFNSWLSRNKRLRGDLGLYQPGNARGSGGQIGQNDLRLKLMRKEVIKRMQNEIEARKKVEPYERSPRIPWPSERSLLRCTSPKRADKVLHEDSPRRSYSSYTRNALESAPSERVYRTSREMLPSALGDELLGVPSRRRSDALETRRIVGDVASDPYMIAGASPATIRAKPITGPPPASSLLNGSYMGEQHLTVGGLLNSLGLQKYGVVFQVEEVDMAALKQMADKDLKDLGIPMGPRKKILLALCHEPPPKFNHYSYD